MGEEVLTAFATFELPQGVVFTRVSFDNAEGCAFAVGADVFHRFGGFTFSK